MRLALVLVLPFCLGGPPRYTIQVHRDCPPLLVAHVQAAADAWSLAVGVEFSVEVTDARRYGRWDRNTIVVLTASPAFLRQASGGELPPLARTVTLQPWGNSQVWVDWERASRLSLGASVTVHELGHALGIRGHSSDPLDVMFDVLGPSVLTSGDIRAYRSGGY